MEPFITQKIVAFNAVTMIHQKVRTAALRRAEDMYEEDEEVSIRPSTEPREETLSTGGELRQLTGEGSSESKDKHRLEEGGRIVFRAAMGFPTGYEGAKDLLFGITRPEGTLRAAFMSMITPTPLTEEGFAEQMSDWEERVRMVSEALEISARLVAKHARTRAPEILRRMLADVLATHDKEEEDDPTKVFKYLRQVARTADESKAYMERYAPAPVFQGRTRTNGGQQRYGGAPKQGVAATPKPAPAASSGGSGAPTIPVKRIFPPRMTDAMRAQLRSSGACMNCRLPGHMRANCTEVFSATHTWPEVYNGYWAVRSGPKPADYPVPAFMTSTAATATTPAAGAPAAVAATTTTPAVAAAAQALAGTVKVPVMGSTKRVVAPAGATPASAYSSLKAPAPGGSGQTVVTTTTQAPAQQQGGGPTTGGTEEVAEGEHGAEEEVDEPPVKATEESNKGRYEVSQDQYGIKRLQLLVPRYINMKVQAGEVKTEILVKLDTGADFPCIRRADAERLGLKWVPDEGRTTLISSSGHQVTPVGRIHVKMEIIPDPDVPWHDDVIYVCESTPAREGYMLLSVDRLRGFTLEVKGGSDRLRDPARYAVYYHGAFEEPEEEIIDHFEGIPEVAEVEEDKRRQEAIDQIEKMVIGDGASPGMKIRARGMLLEFRGVFLPPEKLGQALIGQFAPELINRNQKLLQTSKTPQLSEEQLAFFGNSLRASMRMGESQPSKSPWRSNPVIAKKKGGDGWRCCLGCVAVNKVSKVAAAVMPTPERQYICQEGPKVRLDLYSAYEQAALAPECRERYAFWTPDGLYEPIAIPFGASEVPTWYQNEIHKLFKHLDFVKCHIDDILIEGKDEEEVLANTRTVLTILKEHNLRVNPFKSVFFVNEVKWLGRIVSGSVVRVDPDCIEGAVNMAPPKDKATYRSYRGAIQWLANFIPALACFIGELDDKLKKERAWEWTEADQKMFDRVKAVIADINALKQPDRTAKAYICGDYSAKGIALMLYQIAQTGRDSTGPLYFYSRKLKGNEKYFTVPQGECLVMYTGLGIAAKLGIFELTLQTDHTNLLHLDKLENDMIQRMRLRFADFKYTVVAVDGRSNCLGDFLSRCIEETPEALAKFSPASALEFTLDAFEEVEEDIFGDVEEGDEDEPAPSASAGEGRTPARRTQDRRHPTTIVADFNEPKEFEGLPHTRNEAGVMVLEEAPPAELRIKALALAHSHIMCGHTGVETSFQRLSTAVTWPGAHADMKQFVAECDTCQRLRAPVSQADYMASTRAYAPYTSIFMDFSGPWKDTVIGEARYVFSAIDRFSHEVVLTTAADVKTDTVIQCYRDCVLGHAGIPERLTYDGAGYFMSTGAQEFFEAMADKTHTSAPHSLEGHAPVEHTFWVVAQHSRALRRTGVSWVQNIKIQELAFNTTVSSVLGVSPWEITHAQPPRIPVLAMTGGGAPSTSDPLEIAAKNLKLYTQLREAALKAQEKGYIRAKKYYEAKARGRMEYQAGDYVLLNVRKTKPDKLEMQWKGPFEVMGTDKDTPAAEGGRALVYIIKDLTDGLTMKAHINRLAIYNRGDRTAEELAGLACKVDEYLVEVVYGHRFTEEGDTYFRVDWTGYEPTMEDAEDAWVSYENCHWSPKIQEYIEQRKGLRTEIALHKAGKSKDTAPAAPGRTPIASSVTDRTSARRRGRKQKGGDIFNEERADP